ncbi:MAG TPA: sugar ABC transporter permease [Pseudothermotoga sp.]|mgnify:CR=1 FL=1|nr:sugar ABC transporter permease [Pseudothermotoga sp.]HOK83478.1 sugar ABC transporter permease [Pseudothermotoga sp.]HPP69551.1 sugar ABC transporter permease [Pseudothermotoga sp.]
MTVYNKRKHTLLAYMFFLPFGILLVVFKLIPFVNSVRMVFYKWDVLGTPQFIGLANFTRMFSDRVFLTSLWHTFYFVILTVPPILILSFLIAVLANSKIYGKGFVRSAFYLPYTLTISVVCLTWALLYNPYFGMISKVTKFFGLKTINWLVDPLWAMPAVSITTVWWTMGFSIVLYIAGLQQIPSSYYEAAELDGASSFKKMIFITIPLLKRVHILVIVTQIIASLQIFGQVYIMTAGGPAGKTRTVMQYIYEQGFRYFRMGYAQSMAFIMFLIMLVFAYLQLRLMISSSKEELI